MHARMHAKAHVRASVCTPLCAHAYALRTCLYTYMSTGLGIAEDYLRVATNVSTTVEAMLACEHGLDVTRVFTFASSAMPIVAAVPHVFTHVYIKFFTPVYTYIYTCSSFIVSSVAMLSRCRGV